MADLAFRSALSGLLIAMSLFDLRTRLIPAWLTHPVLVAIALARALQGDVAAPLLLFAAFTDQWWQLLIVLVANMSAPSLPKYTADPAVTFAWLGVLALWRAHLFGGGDAKLLMILFGLYPTFELVTVLAVVSIAVSVPLLVWQYHRKHAPSQFRAMLPSAERLRREGKPLAFMYALAGVLYIWLLV